MAVPPMQVTNAIRYLIWQLEILLQNFLMKSEVSGNIIFYKFRSRSCDSKQLESPQHTIQNILIGVVLLLNSNGFWCARFC